MMNRFKFVPVAVVAGIVGLMATSNGCSSANDIANGAKGCDGLDVHATAQVTVKAYADAAAALDDAATKLATRWGTVCNAIIADVNKNNPMANLDTTQTDPAKACGVLQTYISAALSKGVTISLTVTGDCTADVSVQGSCQADCAVAAKCDVRASCTGGDVSVQCNGSCDATCDVQAPSFMCNGTCKGECTASAAVSCTGECKGSCDATFSGSCGGTCNGTCSVNGKDTQVMGACAGTCKGSCDAMATGTCGGQCKGSCNVAAGAMCNGTCNGTCSYTPGMATCQGTCHGKCSAEVSPPTCNGTLNCTGTAECQADCKAKASAKLDCPPPQVQVVISGDDGLYAAFQAHIGDIGAAFQATAALKDPVLNLAGKTVDTFKAVGDIGVAGATCFASSLSVAAHASAQINVSVSASATVSGSSK